MVSQELRRGSLGPWMLPALWAGLWLTAAVHGQELPAPMAPRAGVSPPLVQQLDAAVDRLEMTVNTSRILTLDRPFPKVQVNNPELLELTILSETEVQVFAKKPGVTQVNVWKDDETIQAIDVIVYGDAQELTMLLQSQFPNARLKVIPLPTSVVISGYVNQPTDVPRIIEIAQDFHPKVINNISIDGVQEVLLHVKVMEVSRTKLRRFGMDWGFFNSNDFVSTGVSGLIGAVASGAGTATTGAPAAGVTFNQAAVPAGRAATTAGATGTLTTGIVSGSSAFFGVLDALVQNNLAKVLSEPTLVTVSGRPAYFNVGGEVPVPASGLGAANVTFRPFGTQVDFVPIVRGGGRIRLEVRPRISDVDPSLSVSGIPGFRVRTIDTGVDMMAGETLALGGLVQTRVDAQSSGLPWLSELPIIGFAFGTRREQRNEVELLIMVTPQIVSSMKCEEVPPGGPGLMTGSPTDCQLFFKNQIEVPGHPLGGNHRTHCKQDVWDGFPARDPCPAHGCGRADCPTCGPQGGGPPPGMLQGHPGGGGEVYIDSEPTPAAEPLPAPPVPMPVDSAEARSAVGPGRTPAAPASSRRRVVPVPPTAMRQPVVAPPPGGAIPPGGMLPAPPQPAPVQPVAPRYAPQPAPQPGLIGPSGYDVQS